MAFKDAPSRVSDSTTSSAQQPSSANPPVRRSRNGISRSRKRARLFNSLLCALSTQKGFKKIRRLVLNVFGLAFIIVANLFGLAILIVHYGERLFREFAAAFRW